MRIPQAVSENPVKIVISVLTAASMMIGSVLYVDDRYAHATDVSTDISTLKDQQKQMLQQQHDTITQLRRESLEDKIFELSNKPHPTDNDRALINYYTNKLHDLQLSGMQK